MVQHSQYFTFTIHIMNPQEIEFFRKQQLEFIDVIGYGSYGIIYYVYSTVYREYFVLKKISKASFNKTEVECLMLIDDERIVRLYKFYEFEGFIYLLMEYCPFDLERLLIDRSKLVNLHKYISDIVNAVKACHDRKIAHCDIKCSNFLIDSYGRMKLGDFGMSTICSSRNHCNIGMKGTLNYISPEILESDEYDPIKSDIWSIGVTIFYVATGKYPFFGSDEHGLRQNIIECNYAKDMIRDPELRDLISKCLQVKPESRCSIEELIHHPYFSTPHPGITKTLSQKNNIIVAKPRIGSRQVIPKFRSVPNMFNSSLVKI
ncbi:CAMK family protein kinase [Trichomonas vaginalis G3]|uniref:CAMK family protein kinase n=1 Tax=Trichomonas vaginalis (strain ATCC PRA-98 / G3) TaxID=412133 RepID=A2F6S5_TRIV3|nr:protein serine/threonine kinase protein [Trichomonas vaginalis G3]EAX99403.1 CAMK family protein kinase [Trichomonas vaginalis G3]KAI5509270.1 protein serine/threonine kinase protein [Trichomonas vaginalis G3]|eukprot:XP_001312333.1 CAMK family protein kinase [Trichomonas vaginalis G3]